MKEKYTVKEIILSLMFNVLETATILVLGWLIHDISILDMITVCISFFIPRMLFKGASHYKNPIKCYVVSTLLGISLFSIHPYHEILCYISSFFVGVLLTEKGDIFNFYQWTGRKSKYDPLKEFVSRNPNNKYLIENERYWEEHYYDRYTIFIMIFRENKTYPEVNKAIGVEPDNNNKIKEECKIIYATFEKTLRLPPL